MIKFTPRRHLTGGLRLPAHKAESTEAPIRKGPLPARLILSTRQHSGDEARPVVSIGQRVARGETLARASDSNGADVHAPAAGTVIAIEPQAVPLGNAVSTESCIVLETNGTDTGSALPLPSITDQDRIEQLTRAGIVGLGGAVYPTAAKIRLARTNSCELLIINGAECEPYISCDDMLMREAPAAIVAGARILMNIVSASRCIIAIERDKPQAIDAMTSAAEEAAIEGLSIAELPSIYPAGGERQLLDVLATTELQSNRYPGELGYLCQNVGTARAVDKYFNHGEPLLSRIVTVTGNAVVNPGNIEALIGTPIRELIEACGGYREKAVRLIHGGSMMGFSLEHDELPVTKSTNCIIAATAYEVRSDAKEWPCIRCGECSIACPARLLPQDLLLAARAQDNPLLETLSLAECIECGCCDVVCPSHIPLTQTFRQAKPAFRRYREQKSFTDAADARYQSRTSRRSEAQQEAELQREALKQSLSSSKSEEIQAAVQRARARKTASPKNDN